jgi:hypothetical protein
VESIEDDDNLTVVVFTSRNPEFFLAHYDTDRDPAKTVTMPPGPTGMQPWLEVTARLIRAPVVSIASIRGRARGAGSEFIVACDIRLAGDKAILARFEVATGVVPGGGPMARLPRLIGRGRALEVLLVGEISTPRWPSVTATSTGSCRTTSSRRRPTASRAARRPSTSWRFAEIKAFVDAITLPDDPELPPGLTAFFASTTRPTTQARLAALASHGLGSDSELERRLGELVTLATAPPDPNQTS